MHMRNIITETTKKIVSIITLTAFICGSVVPAYADGKDTLSVQSIFNPLSSTEIKDIGIIKYFLSCLSKSPGYDHLRSSERPMDVNTRLKAEGIDVKLGFSETGREDIAGILPNVPGSFIVPCYINAREYFAFVSERAGEMPEVTVYTTEEIKAARQKGIIRHAARKEKDEQDIAHEKDIDTPLAVIHGLVPRETEVHTGASSMTMPRVDILRKAILRRTVKAGIDEFRFSPEGVDENTARDIVHALRSGKVISIDLGDLVPEQFDEPTEENAEHIRETFWKIRAGMMVLSREISDMISHDARERAKIRRAVIELLKNAFVHGNKLDLNYPILMTAGFNFEGRVDGIEVWDAALEANPHYIYKREANKALLFGSHLGIATIERDWSYTRLPVYSSDRRLVGARAVAYDKSTYRPGPGGLDRDDPDLFMAFEIKALSEEIEEDVLSFLVDMGADNVLISETLNFLESGRVSLVPDMSELNIDIRGKTVTVPVEFNRAHASNRFINIPQSAENDAGAILVHEISAKCGETHEFSKKLDELYRRWQVSGQTAPEGVPQEIAAKIRTMRFIDISGFDGRDLSSDGDDAETEQILPEGEKAAFENVERIHGEDVRGIVGNTIEFLWFMGRAFSRMGRMVLAILGGIGRTLRLEAVLNLLRMALVEPLHYVLELIYDYRNVDGIDEVVNRLTLERGDQLDAFMGIALQMQHARGLEKQTNCIVEGFEVPDKLGTKRDIVVMMPSERRKIGVEVQAGDALTATDTIDKRRLVMWLVRQFDEHMRARVEEAVRALDLSVSGQAHTGPHGGGSFATPIVFTMNRNGLTYEDIEEVRRQLASEIDRLTGIRDFSRNIRLVPITIPEEFAGINTAIAGDDGQEELESANSLLTIIREKQEKISRQMEDEAEERVKTYMGLLAGELSNAHPGVDIPSGLVVEMIRMTDAADDPERAVPEVFERLERNGTLRDTLRAVDRDILTKRKKEPVRNIHAKWAKRLMRPDSGLIGKYMPLDGEVIEFVPTGTGGKYKCVFNAENIESGGTEEVVLWAEKAPKGLFEGYRRTGIAALDERMDAALKSVPASGRFVLRDNPYGIYGMGYPGMIAVGKAFENDDIALFHELAHVAGIDVLPYIGGGSAALDEYISREGKGHRRVPGMRTHYAIRSFQKEMWPEDDAALSRMIGGLNAGITAPGGVLGVLKRGETGSGTRQVLNRFKADYGLLGQDAGVIVYINGLIRGMYPDVNSNDLPIVEVLASRGMGPNAMVLADGHMIFSPELLEMVEYEEELIFVLLHEMAHLDREHFRKMDDAEKRNDIRAKFGLLRYSEYEADVCAFNMMSDLGYNPQGAVSFMNRLRARGENWGMVHGSNTDRMLNMETLTYLKDYSNLSGVLEPLPDGFRSGVANVMAAGGAKIEKVLRHDTAKAMDAARVMVMNSDRYFAYECYNVLHDPALAKLKRMKEGNRDVEDIKLAEAVNLQNGMILLGDSISKIREAVQGTRVCRTRKADAALATFMATGMYAGTAFLGHKEMVKYTRTGAAFSDFSRAAEADPARMFEVLEEILASDLFREMDLVVGEKRSFTLMNTVFRTAIDAMYFDNDEGFDSLKYAEMVKRIMSALADAIGKNKEFFEMDPVVFRSEENKIYTSLVYLGLMTMYDLDQSGKKGLNVYHDTVMDGPFALDKFLFMKLIERDGIVDVPDLRRKTGRKFALPARKVMADNVAEIADYLITATEFNGILDRYTFKQLADAIKFIRETHPGTNLADMVFKKVAEDIQVGTNFSSMKETREGIKFMLVFSANVDEYKKYISQPLEEVLDDQGTTFEDVDEIAGMLNDIEGAEAYYGVKARIREINLSVGDIRSMQIGFLIALDNQLSKTDTEDEFFGTLEGFFDNYPIARYSEAATYMGPQELEEHVRGIHKRILAKGLSFVKGRNIEDMTPVEIKRLYVLSFFQSDIFVMSIVQEYLLLRLVRTMSFREALDLMEQISKKHRTADITQAWEYLIEEKASTVEEMDELESKIIDVFRGENGGDFFGEAGTAVGVDAAFENILKDQKVLLEALMESGKSDAALKNYLLRKWMAALGRAMNLSYAKYYAGETTKEDMDKWATQSPYGGANIPGYYPLNRVVESFLRLGRKGKYLLLRKLLTGRSGILKELSGRKRLLEMFLGNNVVFGEEETVLKGVLESVLNEFVASAGEDQLYFALNPVIMSRIGMPPAVPTPWQSVEAFRQEIDGRLEYPEFEEVDQVLREEALLDAAYDEEFGEEDLIMDSNDRRKKYIAEAEKERPAKEAMEKRLLTYIYGYAPGNEGLEEIDGLFLSIMPEGVIDGEREPMTGVGLILNIAQRLGSPGVRFLQLMGQFIDLPADYEKEFSEVYDSMVGQSRLTAYQTIKREMPGYAAHIKRFGRRLGGGSIMTVYEVELDDGSVEVVKVRNPNAEYFANESLKLLEKVITALAENDDRYQQVLPLLDDVRGWIERDLNDPDYGEEDVEFAEVNEGYRPHGFDRSIYVPANIASGSKYMIREPMVAGHNLTKIDEAGLDAEDRKEVASLIVRNYLDQIKGSILKGRTLVHSDVHPGNFRVTPDGRVAILDRSAYISLSLAERFMIKRLSDAGSMEERLDIFLDHVSGQEGNEQVKDKAQRAAIRTKLLSGIDEKGSFEANVLELLIGMKREGLKVPLKITLLIKNLQALKKIALDAGFSSLEEAAGYKPPKRERSASRDIKGYFAYDSDAMARDIISGNEMVELSYEKGRLRAWRIKDMGDAYMPGVTPESGYRAEEIGVSSVLTREEADSLMEWITTHQLPDGKPRVRPGQHVMFRVAMGRTALKWQDDMEHSNIAHAGYRDRCVYIGQDLLKFVLAADRKDLRQDILTDDELWHLSAEENTEHPDAEAYGKRKQRVSEIVGLIELKKRRMEGVKTRTVQAVTRMVGGIYDMAMSRAEEGPVLLAIDEDLGTECTASFVRRVIEDICDIKKDERVRRVLANMVIISGRGKSLAGRVARYTADGKDGVKVEKKNVIMITTPDNEPNCSDFSSEAVITFVDSSRLEFMDYYPVVETVLFTLAKALYYAGVPGYDKDSLSGIAREMSIEISDGDIVEMLIDARKITIRLKPAEPFEYDELKDIYENIRQFLEAA